MESASDLEQIGEGESAPGYLLLQLLSLRGWNVSVTALDDCAAGVRVTADKIGRLGERTLHVEVEGASVAEVAAGLVEQATDLDRERRGGDEPERWWDR